MTDRTTDFPDLLDFHGADALRTAGEVAAPSPAVVGAALSAVRSAAAAERGAAPEVVPLRPRRPGPRTRRLIVSAVAIAAIAAGVSVYPVSGLRGSPPAATASAAGFLRQVAATEARGTATDAPYWKAHTVQSRWGSPRNPDLEYSETPSVSDVSKWFSADSVFFQAGADGQVVKSGAGSRGWIKPLPGTRTEGLSWEEVKRLPSDAAALKAVLEGFYPGGPGSDPEADPFLAYWDTLSSLLAFAPLEPLQRAAVYELLADLPGLRLVGPVKDSTGRSGTAVETDTHDMRIRLIIDPEQGGMLESTIHYHGGEHDGKLAKRMTVVSAGPQQSIPPYLEPSGKALAKPHESTPAP
ncbi:CU044_5270 family protein [Streptomyces sp. NBC_01351]|uniref:CU044_5270 family protein n=1 Tax=Streptomyces sp. NBC_01351 TaxID=2903833 RepID=UPI002E32A80F|nr:CU044_5270 family protein [Streptomyces sp. NBC_01351]